MNNKHLFSRPVDMDALGLSNPEGSFMQTAINRKRPLRRTEI